MIRAVGAETQALNEEAADEFARLDLSCTHGPPSVAHALWLLALTELVDPALATLHALVAAEADPLHDATLSPRTREWRALFADEERRARGGALLSVSRLSALAPSLATYPNRSRLEAIWRETGRGRPVLLRALDSAAWFPDEPEMPRDEPSAPVSGAARRANIGEASAALLLCAGGRMDRVRALPFVTVPSADRVAAIEAWREGDPEPWGHVALAAAAHRARQLREAVRSLAVGAEREADVIAGLGRAGITAGRALENSRRLLSTTMPSLAEDLEVSRPAAAAALDRLVEAGLLREITGRSRDRVYAYDAALAVGERALVA